MAARRTTDDRKAMSYEAHCLCAFIVDGARQSRIGGVSYRSIGTDLRQYCEDVALGAKDELLRYLPSAAGLLSHHAYSAFSIAAHKCLHGASVKQRSSGQRRVNTGCYRAAIQSRTSDRLVSKDSVAVTLESQPSENPLRTMHSSSERSVSQ